MAFHLYTGSLFDSQLAYSLSLFSLIDIKIVILWLNVLKKENSIYFWDEEEPFYNEDLIFFYESIRISDINTFKIAYYLLFDGRRFNVDL